MKSGIIFRLRGANIRQPMVALRLWNRRYNQLMPQFAQQLQVMFTPNQWTYQISRKIPRRKLLRWK